MPATKISVPVEAFLAESPRYSSRTAETPGADGSPGRTRYSMDHDSSPRRVVAKVEFHLDESFPRIQKLGVQNGNSGSKDYGFGYAVWKPEVQDGDSG
jgi:hypothetical protein